MGRVQRSAPWRQYQKGSTAQSFVQRYRCTLVVFVAREGQGRRLHTTLTVKVIGGSDVKGCRGSVAATAPS